MAPEEWRPVLGYEGAYEVSDAGQVRTLDRVGLTKAGQTRRLAGKALTPTRRKVDDYYVVNLHRGGVARTRPLHVLVTEAFHGPRPDPDMQVLHKDGHPANCTPANLRWGTRSENSIDTVRHGAHPQADKRNCPYRHALTMPNLVRSQLRIKRRACLACSRTRAHLKKHPGEHQRISDKYYEAIMKVAA